MKSSNQEIIERQLNLSPEDAKRRLEMEKERLGCKRIVGGADILENMSAASLIYQTEESRREIGHLIKKAESEKLGKKGRAVESIYFWNEFLPEEEKVKLANRMVKWSYDAVRYSDKQMPESIKGLPLKLCYHLGEYLPLLSEESVEKCRSIIRSLKAHLLVSTYVSPEDIVQYDLPHAEDREDEFTDKEIHKDLIRDVQVQKHVDVYTGTCMAAEFLHLQSIQMKERSPQEYGQYAVVMVDDCVIGSFKLTRHPSFLSWVDLKDDKGRVLLTKGGLYILNKADVEEFKGHKDEIRPEIHLEKIKLMPIRVAGMHSGANASVEEIKAAIDEEKSKLSQEHSA